ncbi:protein telomere ends associated isoform X2 [Drosophila montana]|uniref:protein telomere ends associated isoform X2 n=1 Tax=Drosophila montana TaxID=40370 RepID=UPI00313E5F2C
MTSIRKKKKPKCDPKASEQMRNWLTKHKHTNSTPPVTFSMFSKVVENLPDIAFQIQCTEFAGSNKTLDECALWYYNAFYSNPTIRTKYEFRLRSCPLRVREKLLQVTSVGSAEATTNPTRGLQNEWVPTEDGVEVRVNRCGRFLFPVSLATFERYIDKKKVLDGIVRKEAKDKAQRAAMLANEAMCRKLLRKYYNAFYIFPSRRRLERCNFAGAPVALREQLLKIGVPLDELAVKTLEKKSQQQQTTEAPPQADNQPSSSCSCSTSSIVSFGVFEKYIKNIYDIVWRLKLDEPDYAYKGFEECAYEYYLDFYLSPEIRDKYPYVLAPCTSSMKDRLLALPSPEDAKVLLQMKSNASQSQGLTESPPVKPQVENVDANQPTIQDEDIAVESDENQPVIQLQPEKTQTIRDEQPQFKPPVTFQLFKRYIRNIDRIVQQMLCCDRYTGKTEDECALEYYNTFYTNPKIREQFPFQLKPCPARIRDKLLTLPDEVANSADKVTDNSHSNEDNLPVNSDRKLVTLSGITYEFMVSFETFVRYINYAELKMQLDKTYEDKKGKSGDKPNDEQIMNRFYYLFYTDERVRKAFKFNFNAAPASLRETLLKMATPVGSKEQQSPSKVPNDEATPTTEEGGKGGEQEVPTTQPKDSDCEITEIVSFDYKFDVVEDLGKAGRFKFPVSFQTFMRCINYKELIRPLLVRVIQDESQMAAIVESPMHPQYQKILRRYYHSFYVRPNIRNLYDYRFGNVSPELLQKLLAYAEPLDDNANREMAEAANELALANKIKAQEEDDELVKTFPVTFKLFKRCIKNLDEIVQQMLCCEDYKDKSKDECAFEYFKAFYTDPQIRKKFEYTIKPCPAKLRDKLLMLPATGSPELDLVEPEPCEIDPKPSHFEEPSAKESEPGQEESLVEVAEPMPDIVDVNCNSGQSNNNNILVQSERVLITLQDITYEFPVSVQTFKRYINYDTVRIELANAFTKSKQKVDKILSDDRYDLVLLRRFYHSFYVDARARKLCNYNFDAAPAEMQNILLQFAVPCPKTLSIPSPLPSPSTPVSAAISEEKDSREENTVNTVADRLDDQVMQQEALPQRQHKAAIRYPISYNIFSNILNLDEVVQQMQQEAQYANVTANECKLAYFDAFYRTPEIRQKYKCTLKACPALLREKLLQLPEEDPMPEHRSTFENSEGIQSVAALYAARKAELERMDKSNVVQYTPHNLATYIALRTQCPKKRALLEKHFIGRKRLKQKNTEETAAPTTDSTGAATVEPAHGVRASGVSTAMEQSTEAVAKTQCSAAVAAQSGISASKCAMKDVESVSKRNSSAAITTSATTVTTTTTIIAKTIETVTTQKVDNPEMGAVTNTVATTAAESLATNTPAATTANTVTATTPSMYEPTTVRIASNTAPSKPTCMETSAESSSSSSNMAETVAALKKATASMAIPAERATATGLGNTQITLPATIAPTEIPASAAKAAEEFFAESSKEHNIKYLLCTSHGVKKTIWRILSQLSYPEFKTYTSIYKGASLYKDESILCRCYYHVLGKGNWPGNLHLKLQLLPQLLHSKGVELDAFDLGQLSPKMLHYMELLRFSNLDEIVERNFHARTGHDIEDMQELFIEIRKFYKLCWSHDQWLYQVPQVREELAQSIARMDSVPVCEPMEDSASQLPLCMIEEDAPATVAERPEEQEEANRNSLSKEQEEENRNSLSADTVATTAADTALPDLNENELALQESVCPSTQLELSLRPPCFVDMENVFPASQVAESQNDPLNQSICPAAEAIRVKEEPIKFLNMMRFSLNSDSNPNSEFKCEIITSEEQIINLDDDIVEEREAADLACFEINNSNAPSLSSDSNVPSTSGDSFQKLLAEVQRLDDDSQAPTVSMWVPATTEPVMPAPGAETENAITTNVIEAKQPEPDPVLTTAMPLRPAPDKKQMPTTTAVSRKRPRLMVDNVPQLRHEFRPLPIAAMVRIESPDLLNKEGSPQQEGPTSSRQAQQLENQPNNELEEARTVSQELATDNTLMASSQIQHLLDAPFVSKRKVNVDEKRR